MLQKTLLFGGLEVVLFGVLKVYLEIFWLVLFIVIVGNMLGGMVSFGMGWVLL